MKYTHPSFYYLDSVTKAKVLPKAELFELIRIVQRDWLPFKEVQPTNEAEQQRRLTGLNARNKAVKHNMRLVVKLINDKGYAAHMSVEDLLSVGAEGLIKAVERFDLNRGTQFSSYACWWIEQAIRYEIQWNAKLIRIPFHVLGKRRAIIEAAAELASQKIKPTIAAVAQHMGKSEEWVRQYYFLPTSDSLDRKAYSDNDDLYLWDLIGSEEQTPIDHAIALEQQEQIASWLGCLAPQDRQIIVLKFGLNGEEPISQNAISRMTGRSRVAIGLGAQRAMKRLKGRAAA